MSMKLKLIKSKWLLSLLCGATLSQGCISAETLPETEAEFQERMQWFTDAQFGLFIHFGVYSTLAGEWKGKPIQKYAEWIQRWGKITPDEYIPLAANFSPDKLDADLWVKTAKEAGMKYMVITSKHHEGFCLWDSAETEYDIGEATDFDRDILGELKAACDKYGLKFGTYYSLTDWHHPSQRAEKAESQTPMKDKEVYVKYMKAQLKELIDRYDPAIMWFDGDWTRWWTMEDGTDLYNYLRELSPDLIINNRVAKRAVFKKDYGTPENSTPGAALDHIWEACWTVNHSWGYKKNDENWKSFEELIQKQIDINTKGGNLLLNVGPKGDGSWPEAAFGQLATMGAWNKAHSEAVYGTDYVDLPSQAWGKLAQLKGSSKTSGELFAYVFQWPESGKLLIKRAVAEEVEAATYQGEGLPVTVTEEGFVVDLSSAKPHDYATVIRLKYKGLSKVEAKEVDLGLKGDELILQAADGMKNGKKVDLKGKDYLFFSRRPENIATWSLQVPAPAKYRVKIVYSGFQHRGVKKVTVSIGGEKHSIQKPMPATEALDIYKLLDVGVVNLQEVGTTALKVDFGASLQASDTFRIKTVVLVPLSE